MNERIRELAEQAGLGVIHNGIVLTKNVNAAEAFENFAELIVKECALTAGLMEHEGRKNIGAQILNNFGVELRIRS